MNSPLPSTPASTPTTIQGAFPHTWQVEVLLTPPLIAPSRRFTYPVYVPGEEDSMARGALELLLRPASGSPFLATCALGFRSSAVPTGVWSAPHPDQLCAVAGGYAYLINTRTPEHVTQIPLRPVTAVRPVEPLNLLLFAGFHHVVAWGPAGLLWQTERLTWEGLTLGDLHDGTLHGTGWHMRSDQELPFTIDLSTGQHTGGAFHP